MTNLQRQHKLNEEKWLVSESKGSDQSGKMDWCKHCDNKCLFEDKCGISQLDREMNCICAKAYNRMIRSKAKNESSDK